MWNKNQAGGDSDGDKDHKEAAGQLQKVQAGDPVPGGRASADADIRCRDREQDDTEKSSPDLTIGPIPAKGYLFPDESRKKFILKIQKEKREEKKAELEELVIQAERLIDSVHDSEMRQLLALKYIDDQTWR